MTGRIGYGITLPALSVASAKRVAQRPMCSLAPKTWYDAAARDALVQRLLKSALPTIVVDFFMSVGSLFLGTGFAILALVAGSFFLSGGFAKRVAREGGNRPARSGGDSNPSQEAAGKPKCYLVGGFRGEGAEAAPTAAERAAGQRRKEEEEAEKRKEEETARFLSLSWSCGGQGKENMAHRINLNESISKIKKKLPQLGLAQLRGLSAEEASGKNRKGLQSEIKKAMNAA